MASSSASAFSLAETTSTRVSGSSSRSLERSTGPPRPGMRMSASTTSGRSSRVRRSPSSPSAAWPTTSMPGSTSSEAMNPSRTRGKSSTTRTRIFMVRPSLLVPAKDRAFCTAGGVCTKAGRAVQEKFTQSSAAVRVRSALRAARSAHRADAVCSCDRGPITLDFGTMAYGVLPTDEITRLRVLAVHTNFAVGSAIARRLIDAEVVALAHSNSVLDGNQDPRAYDVVLLCPYLPDDERQALLETCLPPPAGTVIDLRDSEEGR